MRQSGARWREERGQNLPHSVAAVVAGAEQPTATPLFFMEQKFFKIASL